MSPPHVHYPREIYVNLKGHLNITSSIFEMVIYACYHQTMHVSSHMPLCNGPPTPPPPTPTHPHRGSAGTHT